MPGNDKKRSAFRALTDVLFYTVCAIIILYLLITLIAPRIIISSENTILGKPPYRVSAEAATVHHGLFVADMHADSLIQKRDLLSQSDYGHVDIPRLRKGNVSLQIFTVVTKVPAGQNYERNTGKNDLITFLAILQRWPVNTWFSLKQRAVYQADKLSALCSRPNNRFVFIRSKKDIAAFLERRKSETGLIAAVLGLEGAHALEGKIENLDLFYRKGYRVIGLTHFFDNEAAGSTHGMKRGGLTAFGTNVVVKMSELRLVPDLAHASEKTANELLDLYRGPVIVSHTGVKGVANNNRNIGDALIKRIAKSGGVIGIGFWDEAAGSCDVRAIVRSIKYVRDLVGADYVGLGSDFDGTVTTPFDASGMALITQELLKAGFSKEEIAKIMGGNVLRVLETGLPE